MFLSAYKPKPIDFLALSIPIGIVWLAVAPHAGQDEDLRQLNQIVPISRLAAAIAADVITKYLYKIDALEQFVL